MKLFIVPKILAADQFGSNVTDCPRTGNIAAGMNVRKADEK